jgi:UDP-N-acetylmuramoyl-tripeptide--D-alanyl-D-alanine ligase
VRATAGATGRRGLPGIEVPDTRWPWASWRGLAPALCLPLIAVTGSNGKTTVTQMIAAILRAWQGDAALATAGNLNNDIGLPLTLLRLRPRTAWRWSSWA